MKNRSAGKIQMTSLDELLGCASSVPLQKPEPGEGQIVRLPLSVMHEFKGHPFRVRQDKKMAEMVDSIMQHGVLVPGIVRRDKDAEGVYEIVAGHTRHMASGLAGLPDMPVIIMDLTDDEATVIMVDSNIQREDLLPSEKAMAYRMKYDAMKRMGLEEGGRNDSVLAKEAGESRNTIQRYIRLTYLMPQLLQMVDDGKMPKITASDISYLTADEQEQLLNIMDSQNSIPSGKQAVELKELSKAGQLNPGKMLRIMLKKERSENNISLKTKDIRKYFPEDYTGKQIEETIFSLLQEWKDSMTKDG